MNKLFVLLIALGLTVTSCSSIRWQIGETSDVFLKANHTHQFELVRTSTEWTVYKWTNNWSYTDPPYFFYFHDNALAQVDRGERPPDVIIQTR